ncbi:hypothetical protein NQZ79_g5959 [Umbelopsis isabellina]|nr:hypothetical protein NQZ79_g5959 [Umbelopsis isabellina]
MKTPLCLSFVFLGLIGSSYGCANQAVYDLCLKTGQAAMNMCGSPGTNARCACAAQKQILACYSECPDDYNVFQLGQIQGGQVQIYCSLPGAEDPIKKEMATTASAAMATMASPIHASATEPQATGSGKGTVNNDHAAIQSGTANNNTTNLLKPLKNGATAQALIQKGSLFGLLGVAILMAW